MVHYTRSEVTSVGHIKSGVASGAKRQGARGACLYLPFVLTSIEPSTFQRGFGALSTYGCAMYLKRVIKNMGVLHTMEAEDAIRMDAG